MKRRMLAGVILATIATMGLSGCGTITGTSGSISPDTLIAEDVRDRLSSDPDAGRCHIGVSVADGVVTLDGDVPNDNVRLRAKGIARGTEGVKGIVDNLQSH